MSIIFDMSAPREMLAHCPAYAPTPLQHISLEGLPPVWIKNEGARMGLGAFKALGGVYAVAQLIRAAWREDSGEDLAYARLGDDDVKAFSSQFTYVCASAGNHGLAVATGARLFGAKARIHLAAGVAQSFEKRLKERGAEVVRSGTTYEDSLMAAQNDADATGAVLLADGAWPGYTEIPRTVMEGYTVIGAELREQFAEIGAWPTHVFLQGGVGGLAGSVTYALRQLWRHHPEIIIVEPDAATCLAACAAAGEMVAVEGAESNMGRLDCKEASTIAVEILRGADVSYMSVSDVEAEASTALLAQAGIASTPSGTAGLAGLMKADLPPDARPLIIVSEAS